MDELTTLVLHIIGATALVWAIVVLSYRSRP